MCYNVFFDISLFDIITIAIALLSVLVAVLTWRRENRKPNAKDVQAIYYKFQEEDRRTGQKMIYRCGIVLFFVNNSKYPVVLKSAELNCQKYKPNPKFNGIFFVRKNVQFDFGIEGRVVKFPMKIDPFEGVYLLFEFDDITSMFNLSTPTELEEIGIRAEEKPDKPKLLSKKYKKIEPSKATNLTMKIETVHNGFIKTKVEIKELK